jgi:PKD domain
MSAADGQQVLWTQGYYGTYRTFRTWVHLHSPGPTPPALVGFRATAPASAPANEVALEASVLQPGPSPPVSLVWRLGDGQTAFGSSVRHRYPRPGDYFPRLEVRDANGVESVYVREIRAGN